MTIKGIDISHYQGTPDFDLVKDQVRFVILKATEGINYTDPTMIRNRDEARRVGLLLGYYHFAKNIDPVKEADYFISKIQPLPGELLVLDFEVPATNPVAYCKAFLDRVFDKTQTRALIYLNKAQIKANDWKSVIDANYGLWVASYDGVTSIPPVPWASVAMKQYTSSGSVSGIVGKVDMDTFFGSEEAYKKYGYKGGNMADMYNGQDLSNREAMKICVDDHNAIQAGVYTKITQAEIDKKIQQARDDGFAAGVASVPTSPSGSVDFSKWKENGMIIETTDGNKKTTINYERVA